MARQKQLTWRERCRAAIVPVIEANRDKSERELRKLIRSAWPFGPITPYVEKIWLSEVRYQLTKDDKPRVDFVSSLFPTEPMERTGPYGRLQA